jgi:hypothetical protein
MMKKYLTFNILLLFLVLCFSVEQSKALSLIDPYPNQNDSTVAFFSGQIGVGVNEMTLVWPGGIPPEGAVYQNQLPVGQSTYGYKLNDDPNSPFPPKITTNDPISPSLYFARSTIDTAQDFLSSEANYPTSNHGIGSSVTIYTKDLPTSASFSVLGDSTIGIQVYASTPSGTPLSTAWEDNWYGFMPDMVQGDVLGYVLFSMQGGYLSWNVERWSWLESGGGAMPTLNQTSIYSGIGEMDFSQLDDYISGIINSRTSDYYYSGTVQVYSTDISGNPGYLSARLNYNTASVPEPTTMLLLGLGLIGLAGVRRKVDK